MADEWIDKARILYERAIFNEDTDALDEADRHLDAEEAALSLARGRVLHVRFLHTRVEDPRELPLFERATHLYGSLHDARGEAEALFWIGCFHQVVRGDHDTATPALRRAAETDDPLIRSYALRHLGIAAHASGDLTTAHSHLTWSTRLRRDLGFTAGVAANLVGLAHIAAAEGNPDEAHALLTEARTAARSVDARSVLRQIDEATADLESH
jgi:tetratricopeptide (TPR) repeat protein